MATSEHFYYFVENTRGVGIKIISSWVVFFRKAYFFVTRYFWARCVPSSSKSSSSSHATAANFLFIWTYYYIIILLVCLQSLQILSGLLSWERSSVPELFAASSLTLFSVFPFLHIASWHVPASWISERRLWCTCKPVYRELKCHSLKNILSWCDEYFTVGIFLVSVVSFLCTHRSTYPSGSSQTGGQGDGTGVFAAYRRSYTLT